MEKNGTHPGSVEGERSSVDTATGRNTTRWSANHKKEAVLRLMRGEPLSMP